MVNAVIVLPSACGADSRRAIVVDAQLPGTVTRKKQEATGQAEYWIEFIHGVLPECIPESDGLASWVGGGKGIARNLPVAADLLQNEQLLVALGDLVARGVDRRCPG